MDLYASPTEPSLAKVPKPTAGMVMPLLRVNVRPRDMMCDVDDDVDVNAGCCCCCKLQLAGEAEEGGRAVLLAFLCEQ